MDKECTVQLLKGNFFYRFKRSTQAVLLVQFDLPVNQRERQRQKANK